MSALRERVTMVWLGLMVLTCATTWGLSKDVFSPCRRGGRDFPDRRGESQVRDVGLHGATARADSGAAAFEAWPVVVAAMILGVWFATPAIV